MKFTEFKNNSENAKRFSVYLFEGEDAYFRENALKSLCDELINEPSLNYAQFDGENFDKEKFMSSIAAYPFLSEKRLTAITEFYPKADFVKELSDLCKTAADSVLAIVNVKPCETLKKIQEICVVDCNKADKTTVVKWIRAKASQNDVEIDGVAASMVAEFCKNDMQRVSLETEKLICFAGKGGVITENDVSNLAYKDNEYKIYELTDFIAKKQYDKAFSVITDMLGKGETSQRILIAVYNYLRRLLFVSISGGSLQELSKMLGIKEFAVQKAKEQASKFNVRTLKKAVDAITKADYNIKSGTVVADEAMWNVIFRIMTENLE